MLLLFISDAIGTQFSAPSHDLSVRPQPSKAVYILNGPNIESWSSSSLMKTCYSLVDTMVYDVKSITLEAFQRGELFSVNNLLRNIMRSHPLCEVNMRMY